MDAPLAGSNSSINPPFYKIPGLQFFLTWQWQGIARKTSEAHSLVLNTNNFNPLLLLSSMMDTHEGFIKTMLIQVVEFSSRGTKLERFLPKNQHTQRKLLNFKNW